MEFNKSSDLKLPKFVKKQRRDIKDRLKELDEKLPVQTLVSLESSLDSGESIKKALASLNLYKVFIPKIYGGEGFCSHNAPILFEGLASRCLGLSNVLGSHYAAFTMMMLTRKYETIGKVLKKYENKKDLSFSLGITEPSAGSDLEDEILSKLGNPKSSYKKVDGGYKVSGEKCYISNSLQADLILTTAYLNERNQKRSLIFLLDKDEHKFEVSPAEIKLGQNLSPASTVFFKDVEVKDNYILMDLNAVDESGLDDLNCSFIHAFLSQSRSGLASFATGQLIKLRKIMEEYGSRKEFLGQRLIDDAEFQIFLGKIYQAYQIISLSYNNFHNNNFQFGPFKEFNNYSSLMFSEYFPVSIQRKVLNAFLSPDGEEIVNGYIKNKRYYEKLSGLASSLKNFSSIQIIQLSQECLSFMEPNSLEYSKVLKIYLDSKLLGIYEGDESFNQLNTFYREVEIKDINHFDNERSQ